MVLGPGQVNQFPAGGRYDLQLLALPAANEYFPQALSVIRDGFDENGSARVLEIIEARTAHAVDFRRRFRPGLDIVRLGVGPWPDEDGKKTNQDSQQSGHSHDRAQHAHFTDAAGTHGIDFGIAV